MKTVFFYWNKIHLENIRNTVLNGKINYFECVGFSNTIYIRYLKRI